MEQKYADGKIEGRIEGAAEEKQRAQAKTLESARKMLARGMLPVEIVEFLDLDLAEIEKLKELNV